MDGTKAGLLKTINIILEYLLRWKMHNQVEYLLIANFYLLKYYDFVNLE
jgi:hypothetical protein